MDDIHIPLSSPDITEAEIQAVVEVMRTRHLSLGPKGPDFEAAFQRYLGVEHAIAVSSGTAGLHCCLLALGIGPGDEVITTPFSFIASSNVIKMVGATPVFVDIESSTLNMDVEKAERAITPKTKAILGVEAFGNPAGMHEIAMLAARHEIPLIEDSCEGLGSSHKKRKVGTFGRCGVFGFYPNKQITTGEGGMIVTSDRKLADLCRSLRNQGRDPGGSWLSHVRLGYNYRLSDINAAIGIVQMQRLDEIVEARQRVAHEYIRELLDESHIILPTIDEQTVMSWFVFVVRLTSEFDTADRDAILAYLRNHHIGCSNYFPPIHLQPFYVEDYGFKRGDFPITEYVADRTIALPFHNHLTRMEIEAVVHHLKQAIAHRLLHRAA
ncbi:MAG TPA: DegT/DnrJ/EryC1/StrS family aminotransferase [Phycisphaerae bacterium]|nr:DegT/DnrJ/EryC1/StrS family aminotransferase [Phycisphaerae bacterium]